MANRVGDRRWVIPVAFGLGLAAWGLLRREAYDLRGKVVLITGSSRGLGFALAQEFARQGARLVLCARTEADLERARHQIMQLGAEVLAVPCDVSDREQVQQLVERAMRRFGGIDVLVNNAGIITVGPIETQTLQDFEESLGVMFWGTLYPTLSVLPDMQARRAGRIVNITSIGGKVSVPHLVPYCCAKFAAVGFSEGLRAELLKDGVLVTTVVPGLMRTGSFVNAYFKGQHRAEYTWFSLLASLPITSMDAREAARQIVAATRRGEAELILTWQARFLARFHGLFPGTTANLLGLVNRLLPRADGVGRQRVPGKESETAITASWLTALGKRAAERLLEYGRPAEAPAPLESPRRAP